MAPGVPANLIERLRRCRADAVVASGSLAVRALQAELAAIPVESTRDGAMRRFHILLVCASVMKRDPLNYHRAVGKAYDSLIHFLQDGGLPPVRAGIPDRAEFAVGAGVSEAASLPAARSPETLARAI